jgi:virginiamycin B lyase
MGVVRKRGSSALGAAVAAALLASCGGGGGGAAPSAGLPAANATPTAAAAAPAGSGTLSFQIAIPSGNAAASGRSPKFVSPSTASVTVTLDGQTSPLATANLSSTAPNCSVAPGGTVCTVTFTAPAGNDTFVIATYDGQNGTGHQLSVAKLVQSVTANATAKVPLALSGVVASVAVILGSSTVPAGAAAAVAVTVVAYDAQNNAIVGPGSFNTPVTLTNSDTSGVTSLSTTTVAGPGTSVTLNYNGNSSLGTTITPYIGSTAGTPATFTPTGYAVTNYNVPSSDTWYNDNDSIAAGPDGNLWYATYGIIGKVTPSGQFTEYGNANGIPSGYIGYVAAGPDGNMWFAINSQIGKISPSGVVTMVTSYTEPGNVTQGTTCNNVYGISKGPDGNLWFSDYTCGYIGVLNPSTMTAQEYDITQVPGWPAGKLAYLWQMAFGPDGKLYVTNDYYPYPYYGIDQISIANGAPTAVVDAPLPSGCEPEGIVLGPDANIWFSDNCSNIGVVSPANFATAGMSMWSVNGVTDGDPLYYLASSPGGIWGTDDYSDTIYRITGLSGVAADTSGGGGKPAGAVRRPAVVAATTSTPPVVIPVKVFAYAYASPYAIGLGPDGNIWTFGDADTPIPLAKVVYGAAGAGISATSKALAPMSRQRSTKQRRHSDLKQRRGQ